jgi:cytochrome c-type biogenesis protein CcmF
MSYSVEREATLKAGETLAVERFLIRFEGLRASEQPTHLRVEGLFRVSNNGHEIGVLNPALKFFPTQQSPVGRAVFRSTLSEDLYLILSGFSQVGQGQTTLKAMVRPLVAWIWLGGAVITIGTLVAFWPLGGRAGYPPKAGAAE